jgi:hypothetical protein
MWNEASRKDQRRLRWALTEDPLCDPLSTTRQRRDVYDLAVLLVIVTIALVRWPASIDMMSKTGEGRFRLTPDRLAIIGVSLSLVVAICLDVARGDAFRRPGYLRLCVDKITAAVSALSAVNDAALAWSVRRPSAAARKHW